MLATDIRRGPLNRSDKRLDAETQVVSMKGCPDCQGRGWFLINPFATGGANGAGGYRNKRQCLCCLDCEKYFQEHGTLPDDLKHILQAAD